MNTFMCDYYFIFMLLYKYDDNNMQNRICTIISLVTDTIIRVLILWYTYNYMSRCTYILILCYIQLYEYLY